MRYSQLTQIINDLFDYTPDLSAADRIRLNNLPIVVLVDNQEIPLMEGHILVRWDKDPAIVVKSVPYIRDNWFKRLVRKIKGT